jgi:hypothetical protein
VPAANVLQKPYSRYTELYWEVTGKLGGKGDGQENRCKRGSNGMRCNGKVQAGWSRG